MSEMDDCQRIFEQLSAYIDAELSPATCREIEAHLAGCAPCVEFVRSLRKTVELCHSHSATEKPHPLSPEAREELRQAYRRMVKDLGGSKG